MFHPHAVPPRSPSRRRVAAGLAALAMPSLARAQTPPWPSQTIRAIVASPAGSAIDTIARKFSAVLADVLKTTVVVENKPGASGALAATEVARARPDGYTLLFTINDAVVNATSLLKNISYDPRRDFRYICKIAASGAPLVVNPALGPKTLGELIELARRPGVDITYGSFGPGTFPHFVIESLNRAADIKLRHVPYRGSVLAIQDAVANHVSVTMSPQDVAATMRAAGKLNILAIMGDRRAALLPDVPTFAESGFDSFVFRNAPWSGIVGQAALPEEIVQRLYAAVHAALQEVSLRQFLATIGFEIIDSPPARFDEEHAREFAVIPALVASLGVQPE